MGALQQGCGRAERGAGTPLLLQAGSLLSGKGPGPGDTTGQDRFFYASEWQGSQGPPGPPKPERGKADRASQAAGTGAQEEADPALQPGRSPCSHTARRGGQESQCHVHPQVMSHLRDMGRVHRVRATRGFDGERTEQDRTLLGEGPEMGRRVLKVPCSVLEKRICVPSSQTVSAQGAGTPLPAGPERRRQPRAPGMPDL